MNEPYLDLVRRHVPRPNPDQIEAFADYVVNAHSWYKKLPLFPPGEAFFVYLAPHHRQVFAERVDGGPGQWRDIVHDDPASTGWMREFKVDYRDGDIIEADDIPLRVTVKMATETFRRRYGHWSFWNFPIGGGDTTEVNHAADRLSVLGDDGEPILVPSPLFAAGLVRLTALAHPSFASSGPGHDYEVLQDADPSLPAPAAEHARQVDSITVAMHRVMALVWTTD